MNYFKSAARMALGLSILVSLAAVALAFSAAVVVAVGGAFFVLFPLVLLTAPAVKRLAKALEAKLEAFVATKAFEAAEKAKAEAGIPG